MTSTVAPAISLLRPPGATMRAVTPHGAPDQHDLALEPIVRALDLDGRHARFISGVLAELPTDPSVIAYRQDVLDDLLQGPLLTERLTAQLPHLRDLGEAGLGQLWQRDTPLLQVASRLAELDAYLSCVTALGAALDEAGANLRSAGMRQFHRLLVDLRAEPDFARLAEELPRLRRHLGQASSVTLGINLDAQLGPESATILSINQTRFVGKHSLLDRLLGERVAADAVRGVSTLFKAGEGHTHSPEHELFRDLNRLLERVAGPVAGALERYRRLQIGPLSALAPELALLLGAARLTMQLRAAGLPLCRPSIAPLDERACQITGCYCLDLALREIGADRPAGARAAIVANDVLFERSAPLALLTGPNSGGKTTYTRAIGQAQVLCQAGLLVPGHTARISPVDGIYTHFATAERLGGSGGRLAEELERIARIFALAQPTSLLLLNEPLTSTDQAAARTIARDLLAGLQVLGARTLLVTHLHELVGDALALNGSGRAGVVSLVAGAQLCGANGEQEIAPTYTISRGLPQDYGYANELARHYGLSRDQLAQALHERLGD